MHTNKQKSVTYNNTSRTEEFPDQVPENKRYAGKQYGPRGGGFRVNYNGHRGDGARGSFHGRGGGFRGKPTWSQRPQPKCHLCEEPHVTFRCPQIVHEKDENKIKTSLKDKAICAKCIFTHRPNETECREWSKPYICETH